MAELFGYVGTLLKVDLTEGVIEKIPTDTYDLDKWIGGRGLGSNRSTGPSARPRPVLSTLRT